VYGPLENFLVTQCHDNNQQKVSEVHERRLENDS